MSLWLRRLRGTSGETAYPSPTKPVHRIPTLPTEPKDPNFPKRRFQVHQKCLYERTLPGDAFISAHVNRLQHGYYETDALHDPALDNVYLVSIHFVFHPKDHRAHRFKSAVIQVSLHGDPYLAGDTRTASCGPSPSNPRILKHAPELLYGSVSPENLQWNFSLSSSLGVSQTPLSATLNPSGAVTRSYKVYDMMSIQGSIRSIPSPLSPEYDSEDAMAVWTVQENLLQRSGLPREFDFVLLVHKPDHVENMYLSVDVDSVVDAWFGQYPQWYMNLSKYRPSQDYLLDFKTDIGQKFLPARSERGFNFAELPRPLDEYMTMPGTVYPTNDTSSKPDKSELEKHKSFEHSIKPGEARPRQQHLTAPTRDQIGPNEHYQSSRQSWMPETVNVRVMLEHSSPFRRYSGSPHSSEPLRQPSLRRTRPHSGLKEYSAQQAHQEIAHRTPNGDLRGAV
ncbi:hypothetical protein CC78DRAFT_19371 [Lojkania enalia]|uniref:Uncharacterized protein n=1 Tax=Lojkania enalia TaxID=147567 RepID=A0A9P4KI58_9PLEO|nr:hypothetical protein CC78DRAFT_19371 [Didymosphaeria enalia]